ncbi:hypothetical protein [Paraburkholderia strydomiana]|uniref:hypothetical protein n=1 Tax=Paraburkholderia strydomiana TaxID=1245417 RepID=UPI001BE9326B|nr:hypothetical protein [Paraburkholderia strydomiana]MBT2794768.1 hypothetical protein [Paraburkholderia strydomiana]
MTNPSHRGDPGRSESESEPDERRAGDQPMSDEAARDALGHGDNDKITTKSGKDQSRKPDTEGSNSSSKNVDEQDD